MYSMFDLINMQISLSMQNQNCFDSNLMSPQIKKAKLRILTQIESIDGVIKEKFTLFLDLTYLIC